MKAKILASIFILSSIVPLAMAQVPDVNINSPGFHLVTCDGPAMPNAPAGYVPCDFRGLMNQAQYIINVMIVLGVIGAMVGFAYTGYLYISGTQENLKKAHGIFPRIFWGFIIMLTAWFIVYQILQWLTGNAGGYLMTS